MQAYRLTTGLRKLSKALRLLPDARWREALRGGVAAAVEHERLLLRTDYRTVIDGGANRGQFALFARSRLPNAKIYAFEPLTSPRRRLESLFVGEPRVVVMPYALGASESSGRINVARADDSSSLLPSTALQTSRFPGTDTLAAEEVSIQRLDAVLTPGDLEAPVLLKLDVQGFELEALKGASALLPYVDTITVECSFVEFYAGQPLFDTVSAHLVEQGFRLAAGEVSARDGNRWLQGDFVFERVA